MQTTILGRTNLTVSRMGLGAGGHSRIGRNAGLTDAQSADLVRHALDHGVNFIDTAEGYGTESIIGQALQGATAPPSSSPPKNPPATNRSHPAPCRQASTRA